MMTSYVWHCFSMRLLHEKNTGVYYISASSCHTAPEGAQQCWKQHQKYKTKTKTPKLQDQDQDRGRSETGLVISPRSQTARLHARA